MTAVPVVADQEVSLPDGLSVTARTGEWLITNVDQVVDVLSPARFARLYEPAEDKGLVLNGEARTRVERSLGIGSTETPEHLVTAVERLARLTIGDIVVTFTPGQWDYLQHRASKAGLPVKEFVTRMVGRMSEEILTQKV